MRPLSDIRCLVMVALVLASRALAAADPNVGAIPEQPWSFGVSLFWYLAPGEKNFWVVNAGADHGPLHLEARYHDEAIGTASALIGWNFEFGETVKLGLMPLVGSLIGDQGGPILGLDIALGWGPLSFSSQMESLWEVQTGKGWFLYIWSEFDVRPWPWMRAGFVTQRTRLFQTAREFILGPLIGFRAWKIDVSFYWFQPGGIDQTFAAKLELNW